MKIGLMGFEFASPNKGCEALTYSFISLLEKLINKNEEVIIYNFTDYDLGLIPQIYTNFKFEKVVFKLKDITFHYLKKVRECDFIFDVTMGDSFSDIYSLDYFLYLLKQKRIASFVNKKYILLPQTYGPFINKCAKNKSKKVFDNALKIYCRDEMSQHFLKEEFDIANKTFLTSDMAFLLPFDKNTYKFEKSSKTKIGINVSGLLYKGGFNSKNQFDLKLDYQKYILDLIRYLIKQDRFDIYLIPHVIDDNENAKDDDYRFINEIKNKISDVIVAPKFKTPIEAKSYISNMEIFIGSRMHSTIAAFSSDVVTIPVAYSRKFEGLYSSLNYKYYLDGKKESNESALNKTIAYIEDVKSLKEAQKNAMGKIDETMKEFEYDLKNVLNIK